MQQITIDPEFQALIPPLSAEERAQLEANLLADGCRDPLVVWALPAPAPGEHKCYGHDESKCDLEPLDDVWHCRHCEHNPAPQEYVLIDGHNRYEICTRNDIEYGIEEMLFDDREAVMDWMDANQLGRRNITPDQFTLLLGRRYNRAKKAVGGRADRDFSGDQIDPPKTADRLATEHGVSPATVKRAGQYADAVAKVSQVVPLPTAAPRQAVIKAAALIETAPEKAVEILTGAKSFAEVRREEKREEIIERLESVEAIEAKEAEGVFDVIVLDPPWPMQKIERDVTPEQVAFDYPTMSEEELAAMPIPAADDCHVWVWTTHKFLPMSLRLLDAWGMKYVCTFVWHKPGGFQPFGLPQYNCELAVYARIGTPEFIDTKAFNTCFNAPRGAHSEKPSEFYDVVRRVTAGRRLDMFNRRAIDGFEVWGKESAVQ